MKMIQWEAISGYQLIVDRFFYLMEQSRSKAFDNTKYFVECG